MTSISKEYYNPEDLLLNTLNNLDIGFVKISNDGIILNHNLTFNQIFGYNPEKDLSGTKLLEYWLNFEERNEFRKILYKDGAVKKYHAPAKKVDGEKLILQINFKLIKNSKGEIISSEGIFVDITERKKAEEALKASEIMLQKSQEIGQIGSFEMDLATNEIMWSDQLYKLFGLKKEGRTIDYEKVLALIHPDDRERAIKVSSDAAKELKPYTLEHRVIHPDGEILDLLIIGDVICNEKNEVVKIGGTIQDITEHKAKEKKLKESEEEFRKIKESYERLTDNADVAIFRVKIKGREIIYSIPGNPAAERLFGYSKAEWLSDSTLGFKIIHPDFVEKQIQIMDEINKNKKPIKNAVLGWMAKDGHEVIMEYTIIPILDDNGEIIFFESIGVDITDRKKAELKLKESEEKYRTFVQDIQGIAYQRYRDFSVSFFDGAVEEITGYTSDDFTTGRIRLDQIIHPDDAPIIQKKVDLFHSTSAETDSREYRIIRKYGETRWILEKNQKIYDKIKKMEGVEGLIVDITQRKKAENELKELNKMKSEFLRRASHELKTPLISIKGFSDLILSLYADQLDLVIISKLREINDGCERLQNIINNLLKASRLESPELKPKLEKEDLSFLIKFCVHELESLAERRNQSIKLAIQNDLYANIEKEEIHDVISNLLTNAIKYTPPGGKIEIKANLKGDFIIISVKDNGIGFTNEQKEKIFQQFGKIERYGQGLDLGIDGTGLGLYISKRIVESHGGKIWMESDGKSKGSIFFFTLPIVK